MTIIFSILEWWFGLFGIADPNSIRLGITIVASGLALAVLYASTMLIVTFLATILGQK